MKTINSDPMLSLFFDESGKKQSPIQLMGALCVPTLIYRSTALSNLHQLNQHYQLHWSGYSGDSKSRFGIVEAFSQAIELASHSRINVIHYNYHKLEKDALRFGQGLKKEMTETTIYSKFPERIMYGLLRNYSESTHLTAELFIEHANEYERLELADTLKKQLNTQALYRGEPYTVSHCEYRKKNEEIGVELIDLVLGIVRTVMQNEAAISKGKKARQDLILYLYRKELLQGFFEKISLFEWMGHQKLNERSFQSYVDLFIARNFERYKELGSE